MTNQTIKVLLDEMRRTTDFYVAIIGAMNEKQEKSGKANKMLLTLHNATLKFQKNLLECAIQNSYDVIVELKEEVRKGLVNRKCDNCQFEHTDCTKTHEPDGTTLCHLQPEKKDGE